MENNLDRLWAKNDDSGNPPWHPLILHLLDVAAVAEVVLAREPQTTRQRIARILDLPWDDARPWLLSAIACHDLGKCCPGFQCKWPELLPGLGLSVPRCPDTGINHGFISQIALSTFLRQTGWPCALAELVADAAGCHHGARVTRHMRDRLEGNRDAVGKPDWAMARADLFFSILAVFHPGDPPTKATLSGPDFMLLAGLVSFTDWVGSNEDWFRYGKPQDCADPASWFVERRELAKTALDAVGWHARTPLCPEPKSFERLFGLSPRPLQRAMATAVADIRQPSLILMEAPMGEGKTEAAFYAHVDLQRRLGHRGLYIALPSKATGNAMFRRVLGFLDKQQPGRTLDLQLVHGAAVLNDAFQNIRISSVHGPGRDDSVRAGQWFTNKKRALLSEYGVGTVDQALMPILPVRHYFVRLWGLANRVVIFDEIHAYDAYTGTLLTHLVRWLLALGSQVLLLSATLAPDTRRALAESVDATLPEREEGYPRLTIFTPRQTVRQFHFDADPQRRLSIGVVAIGPELKAIHEETVERMSSGGLGLILVNTVQRAQELFALYPAGEPLAHRGKRVGKRLGDGSEVYLLHARFPADWRQTREDVVLRVFGPGADRGQAAPKILIATQVVEQSLDLDLDLIVSDLAPIDLLLQRAGRLWRHASNHPARRVEAPTLVVSGLGGEAPPDFGKPLWWGAVYREDILLTTWCLLRQRHSLSLPDEIDALVRTVYEEEVDPPATLVDRLEKARIEADGERFSCKNQADQAILGLPDDESWNQPDVFQLCDEDDPGRHHSLIVQTRLGEESVTAVPLWPQDGFIVEREPCFRLTKEWALRVVNVSRKKPLRRLRELGVPAGWKKSPLLRNSVPLCLDEAGRWIEDQSVYLDDELGLVYERREKE